MYLPAVPLTSSRFSMSQPAFGFGEISNIAFPTPCFEKRSRATADPDLVSKSKLFATAPTTDKPNVHGIYRSANTDTSSLLRLRSVGMADKDTKMGGTVSVAQQHQEILHNDLPPTPSSSSSSEADLDADMNTPQDESSSYSISYQSAELSSTHRNTKLMMGSSGLMESRTTQAQRQSQSVKISTMEEMNLVGLQLSSPPSSPPSPITKAGLDMDTNLVKDEPSNSSGTSEYAKLSAVLANIPAYPGQIKEIENATDSFISENYLDQSTPSYYAYQSMCEFFEGNAEMLEAGHISGYIYSLDFCLENKPFLRVPIMKALENVGKAFDESKKAGLAQSNEMPAEKTTSIATFKSGSDHKNPNAAMERALSAFGPMASDYVKSAKLLHRRGTSSLHTYEDWHIHMLSVCKIKHEDEIYPPGFNPKLMSIFRKCSKQRLRSERHERYKKWKEQAIKGLTHVHRNPFLSEDVIKECGAESYKELEGKVEMDDMRDAAYWEITSRQIEDIHSRKSKNFIFRKKSSPLRKELKKLEDHWIPEEVMPYMKLDNRKIRFESEVVRERKRRQDIDDEEVEDEQRTYLARMEARKLDARRLEACNGEARPKFPAMKKIRDREKEKEREIRRKERRERKNREVDLARWENRERSDCCITQAWIDMGADMARVGNWD
ncbi:hypothetical protein OCU04_006488 [Sclerotinia nivalis]|uniref:Uncharacterized protein n=1 Tax=Sclerotinia nivalis TaxID=352851 RepID=A0A9X0AN52_9HELO|nr:hypothetical protein OCU04_006488 [Sclerotinia nivalis]